MPYANKTEYVLSTLRDALAADETFNVTKTMRERNRVGTDAYVTVVTWRPVTYTEANIILEEEAECVIFVTAKTNVRSGEDDDAATKLYGDLLWRLQRIVDGMVLPRKNVEIGGGIRYATSITSVRMDSQDGFFDEGNGTVGMGVRVIVSICQHIL